jgi:hypothetical protein
MRPVHEYDSTDGAYTACQCDEALEDGDILHIPNEKVVGLVSTWPMAITKEHGDLHVSKPGKLWNVLTEPYLGKCHGIEVAKEAMKFAIEKGYELSEDAKEIYNGN